MKKSRQFSWGEYSRTGDKTAQARNPEGEWVEYDTVEEAREVAERLDTAYRVVNFTQEFWTYERKDVE